MRRIIDAAIINNYFNLIIIEIIHKAMNVPITNKSSTTRWPSSAQRCALTISWSAYVTFYGFLRFRYSLIQSPKFIFFFSLLNYHLLFINYSFFCIFFFDLSVGYARDVIVGVQLRRRRVCFLK